MNVTTALILFRLVLVPIILGLAYFIGENLKNAILTLMYLGLISDIFDGIIARKKRISTEKLRRMDSQADMAFWLSIGIATWFLYPKLLADNEVFILAIIALEITCYVISFVKFKKETCTHAFISKLWGISLLVAFTSLIGFEHAGIPFAVAIIIGFLAYIDVILILLILPKWAHDIPSAYHAYLIRKGKKFKRNDLLNG